MSNLISDSELRNLEKVIAAEVEGTEKPLKFFYV